MADVSVLGCGLVVKYVVLDVVPKGGRCPVAGFRSAAGLRFCIPIVNKMHMYLDYVSLVLFLSSIYIKIIDIRVINLIQVLIALILEILNQHDASSVMGTVALS